MTIAELQEALTRPGATTPLTRSTLVDVPTGTAGGGTVRVVLTQPASLAAQAGLSREAYALARCIQSEGYGDTKGDPERTRAGKAAAAVAIGQAIVNGAKLKAKAKGTNPTYPIEAALIASNFGAAAGLFGEQSGRYAATTSDPTRWAGEVAIAVLEGGLPDLARGAHKFVDPKIWAGKGTQAGKKLSPFAEVMQSWILGEGLTYIGPIPTVDPYYLILLAQRGSATPLRQASFDQVVDIFESGKAGSHAPAPGSPDSADWLSGGVLLLLLIGCGFAGRALGCW